MSGNGIICWISETVKFTECLLIDYLESFVSDDLVKFKQLTFDNRESYIFGNYYLVSWCCRKGFVEILKYLLHLKYFNYDLFIQDGREYLKLAVEFGNLSVAKFIVCLPNFKIQHLRNNRDGLFTSNNIRNLFLLIACAKGHRDILRFLMEFEFEYGVHLELKDILSQNCFELAYSNGHLDCLTYIVSHYDFKTSYLRRLKDYKTENKKCEEFIKTYISYKYLGFVLC